MRADDSNIHSVHCSSSASLYIFESSNALTVIVSRYLLIQEPNGTSPPRVHIRICTLRMRLTAKTVAGPIPALVTTVEALPNPVSFNWQQGSWKLGSTALLKPNSSTKPRWHKQARPGVKWNKVTNKNAWERKRRLRRSWQCLDCNDF